MLMNKMFLFKLKSVPVQHKKKNKPEWVAQLSCFQTVVGCPHWILLWIIFGVKKKMPQLYLLVSVKH